MPGSHYLVSLIINWWKLMSSRRTQMFFWTNRLYRFLVWMFFQTNKSICTQLIYPLTYQLGTIVTFFFEWIINQHRCWIFKSLTSKCVLGPYMSQIFRLRMSIPFPGCCKTRACDSSSQQNQWLISPCTSRLLCIITFQRLSVDACEGLWRVWISNLAYD